MSNTWRKRQNKPNPFLSSAAQESSERTLEEISHVNPEFARHRKPTRSTPHTSTQSASHNPYVDHSLYDAQHEYGPDANSRFMADHGVDSRRAPHPYPNGNDSIRSNGHHTKRHMVSDSNGHSVHSNDNVSHYNHQAHGGDINQDANGAKSHYAHGKLADLQSRQDEHTVTVKDDNPYHPSNFYKEDKETASKLIKHHRKHPKARVPHKNRNHRAPNPNHPIPPNGYHDHNANNVHNVNNEHHVDVHPNDMDEMESFFESIEAHPNDSPHDAFADVVDGMECLDMEPMHSAEEMDDDEGSEHFREFMADPDAQSPQSPRSSGDSNCIEGCERITPSNFHTMRTGDVVSILMENLWTYYKVVSNERNGDDFVAKFESGFASKEESVFIKDGVISKFITVWGEQSADAVAICREIEGNENEEEQGGREVVENGWIKLEEDGKLHLVVAYEASSGVALLKAMGSNAERSVDLNKCAYKML